MVSRKCSLQFKGDKSSAAAPEEESGLPPLFIPDLRGLWLPICGERNREGEKEKSNSSTTSAIIRTNSCLATDHTPTLRWWTTQRNYSCIHETTGQGIGLLVGRGEIPWFDLPKYVDKPGQKNSAIVNANVVSLVDEQEECQGPIKRFVLKWLWDYNLDYITSLSCSDTWGGVFYARAQLWFYKVFRRHFLSLTFWNSKLKTRREWLVSFAQK